MNILSNRKPDIWTAATFLITAAAILIIALSNLYDPLFSTDSWSYFELSKSVFSDFYRVNTWRQFHINTEYGVSFPPLWPVMIAVFNLASDTGIYSGYFLNVAICLTTLVVFMGLGRVVFGGYIYGVLLFITSLFVVWYVKGEILAANSMPLGVLFTFVLLRLYLVPGRPRTTDALVMGVIAGLTVLNRFDFMMAGGALGLLVAFDARGRRLRTAVAYYMPFVAVMSPWIFYSLYRFGKPMISDNSRTVTSIKHIFVTDYFMTPPPTLFDQPVTWAVKTAKNMAFTAYSFDSTIIKSFFPQILTVLILGGIIHALLSRGRLPGVEVDESAGAIMTKLLKFGLVLLVLIFTVSLTGYGRPSYFATTITYINLLLGLVAFQLYRDAIGSRYAKPLFAATAAVLCLGLVAINTPNGIRLSGSLNEANLRPTGYADIEEALSGMDRDYKDRNLLFAGFVSASSVYVAKFGALTGARTFLMPENLDPVSMKGFVDEYAIDYIITRDGLGELAANLDLGSPLAAGDVTIYKVGDMAQETSPGRNGRI